MKVGYLVGSIIIFILLLAWFGYICFTLIHRYRQGSASFADYIRDFKKGRWTPLYVLAYPLFVMNFAFAGKNIADAFLWGLTYTIKLLSLNFDVNLPLADANVWFKAAIWTANILAVLNLLLFAYSCLRQIIWKWYHILSFKNSKKEKVLIIGDSKHNETIIDSSRSAKVPSILLRVLNSEQCYSLFSNKKPYISCFNVKDFEEKIEDQVKVLFKNHRKNLKIEKELLKGSKPELEQEKRNNFWRTKIIINFENENNNIKFCDYIIKLIAKYTDKYINPEDVALIWPYLDIYVYCSDASENIYKKLIQDSNGSISLLNKYELISRELTTKYPLAKYLNENHIDFNTSLVKPNANLNVCFIGFGKTSKNAFIEMFWNNQLVTKDVNGKIINHKVNYHFFDKNKVINDKSFNHDFLRYINEFMPNVDKSKYLPLLNSLVEYNLHPINVYDETFFAELNKSLAIGDNTINYIVVSLGDDFQSLEIANLVQQKVSQWSKFENSKIFVHVSSKDIIKLHDIQNTEKPYSNIIPFGFDEETIYSYKNIVNDFYTNMCILRDKLYTKSYLLDKDSPITMDLAKVKWKKDNKDIYKRKSSTAAVLCVRQKLLLMGMDFISLDWYNKNNGMYKIISKEDYYKKYGINDPISEKPILDKVTTTGLPDENLNYIQCNLNSRRANLGELEHYRWSAYQISIGNVPMEFNKCLENIKATKTIEHFDPKKYQHVCITTYDGLATLRAEQSKIVPNDWNYFKNDEQLLDNLPKLLEMNNQVIVERKY